VTSEILTENTKHTTHAAERSAKSGDRRLILKSGKRKLKLNAEILKTEILTG
jgi:hypothetical protein